MEEFFARLSENLFGRAGAPLTFRFVVQPAVAVFVAVVPYVVVRGPVTRIAARWGRRG